MREIFSKFVISLKKVTLMPLLTNVIYYYPVSIDEFGSFWPQLSEEYSEPYQISKWSFSQKHLTSAAICEKCSVLDV